VILSDYDIAQVADIRDKIERAARFLTLGSLSAHLAHEIRNPLTSIAGLVELLKDRNPDEQTKLQYIEHIQTSADRLNHLIEGLMDFAAIEKCELTPQPIDAMLREAVEGLRHDARSADREIRLEIGDEMLDVPCSRSWLGRAVINLLNNACEATPVGGTVTMSLHRAGDGASLKLKVHNTGSYIEPSRRKAIFEPFETGRPDGTGLGLSIVQEIVRAHGGSITVDSDVTEGTEFTVCLPLAQTVGA
jgi:signal transduction histidine kinase